MRLHLVPSERQVEALAREGRDAKTLRALRLELAETTASGRERAGPEVTRLIAETVAPEASLAELLDAGREPASPRKGALASRAAERARSVPR